MDVSLGWGGWKRSGESRDLFQLKGSLDGPGDHPIKPAAGTKMECRGRASVPRKVDSFRKMPPQRPQAWKWLLTLLLTQEFSQYKTRSGPKLKKQEAAELTTSGGIRLQAFSLPHGSSTFCGSSLGFPSLSHLVREGQAFLRARWGVPWSLHCGSCTDQSPCPSLLSTLIPTTIRYQHEHLAPALCTTVLLLCVSVSLILRPTGGGVDKEAWMSEQVLST